MSAHPHSWLLVADNLHAQAIALRERVDTGFLTYQKGDGSVLGRWPLTNRATFLLAGFALENAIKGFLVYENPSWVADGKLARKLRSHKLVHLALMSSLAPWPKKSMAILEQFERGLDSWARYPCALSASSTEAEQNLSEYLWSQYLALAAAYGRDLCRLLERGWNGPHGITGEFSFQGEFLSAT